MPLTAEQIERARRILHAASSVGKTSLGVGRLPEAEVQRRLAVCRRCPSGLAVLNNEGDPIRCDRRRGGCGCRLRLKARDRNERCPRGHWPTVQGEVPDAAVKQ